MSPPFSFTGGTFPGTGGTCGSTLATTASCTVVATYTPTATVTSNDTLRVAYKNGQSAQVVSDAVTGTGVTPATLSISNGPTYSFGNVYVTYTASFTFTVTNSAATAATSMSAAALSAPFSFVGGSYPGTNGTCGVTLAGSSNCSVVVQFAPTVAGTFNSSLQLNYYNGSSNQSTSVALTGNGTGVPTQVAISAPATFSAGACTPVTMQAEDASNNPANVPAPTNLTYGGVGHGSFYTDNACSHSTSTGQIAANTSSIGIWFQDSMAEALTLTIATNPVGQYTGTSTNVTTLTPATLGISPITGTRSSIRTPTRRSPFPTPVRSAPRRCRAPASRPPSASPEAPTRGRTVRVAPRWLRARVARSWRASRRPRRATTARRST
jgi:hypothetical protein